MSANKSNTTSPKRTIHVPILARVEGEAALSLTLNDQGIESLQLKIYEPPRLFEKFLEGRSYNDIVDLVARICGICPVAYQMTAAQAIESCLGITISSWTRAMRRVFYCGEWIESHSLHVHCLAAPDFLGFHSVTEMAKFYPEIVRRGIKLQALGNRLIAFLGGRSVHPVGARVGGFYKAPLPTEVAAMITELDGCLEECDALLRWVVTLPFSPIPQTFTCVAMRHPDEYPMNEGRIVSDNGLDISCDDFEQYFQEHQVNYSNALHCLLQGKSYLVGPLARMNINYAQIPAAIQEVLMQAGIAFPSYNMDHNIVARAIEIYYCVLEAKQILENYLFTDTPFETVVPQRGVGYGCTEAPRGLLWQSYGLDKTGQVEQVRIVPPTSQNQARIEEELTQALTSYGLAHSDDALRFFSEQRIRNYDPCISCATHFLKLDIVRG